MGRVARATLACSHYGRWYGAVKGFQWLLHYATIEGIAPNRRVTHVIPPIGRKKAEAQRCFCPVFRFVRCL
jgi:hypothetical protein